MIEIIDFNYIFVGSADALAIEKGVVKIKGDFPVNGDLDETPAAGVDKIAVIHRQGIAAGAAKGLTGVRVAAGSVGLIAVLT